MFCNTWFLFDYLYYKSFRWHVPGKVFCNTLFLFINCCITIFLQFFRMRIAADLLCNTIQQILLFIALVKHGRAEPKALHDRASQHADACRVRIPARLCVPCRSCPAMSRLGFSAAARLNIRMRKNPRMLRQSYGFAIYAVYVCRLLALIIWISHQRIMHKSLISYG